MKNKIHLKNNMHDDPEEMGFVAVTSVRGQGALI